MKNLLIALLILVASFGVQAQTITAVKPTRFFHASIQGSAQYIVVNDSTKVTTYPISELKSISANADYISVNIGGNVTAYKPSQFLDDRWIPYHATNAKLAYFNYMNRYIYYGANSYNY